MEKWQCPAVTPPQQKEKGATMQRDRVAEAKTTRGNMQYVPARKLLFQNA